MNTIFRTLFSTGILLDAVILLFLLFHAISGAKNGFVRMIYRFFRVVIAGIAGVVFAKPLAKFLASTAFYRNFLAEIEKKISQTLFDLLNRNGLDEASESFEKTAQFLRKFGRSPDEVSTQYRLLAANGSKNIADGLSEYLLEPASNAFLSVISFVIVFLLALFAVFLIFRLLNVVSKAPVLNQVNRFLGFLLGLVIAYILSCLFVALVTLATPYLSELDIGFSEETLDKTLLFKFLRGFDPVAWLFGLIRSIL